MSLLAKVVSLTGGDDAYIFFCEKKEKNLTITLLNCSYANEYITAKIKHKNGQIFFFLKIYDYKDFCKFLFLYSSFKKNV